MATASVKRAAAASIFFTLLWCSGMNRRRWVAKKRNITQTQKSSFLSFFFMKQAKIGLLTAEPWWAVPRWAEPSRAEPRPDEARFCRRDFDLVWRGSVHGATTSMKTDDSKKRRGRWPPPKTGSSKASRFAATAVGSRSVWNRDPTAAQTEGRRLEKRRSPATSRTSLSTETTICPEKMLQASVTRRID
jgi:hypothetical protein